MSFKKLGDYGKIKSGFAFKSEYFQPHGFPVIKIKNVTSGTLTYNNLDCVSLEIKKEAINFLTKPSDILIAMTGANVGKVAVVKNDDPQALINQRVGRFIPKKDCALDTRFIYYLMISNEAHSFFSISAYGSAQPNISGSLIEELPVPDISFLESKAIADILSSLDDKITLNQQINQTLESIAQTLFKSWFIDFDPVKAKMAGRVPKGMDADLLALFPDSFEDSELGPIPKGWKIKKLGSVLTPKKGKVITKQTTQTGNVPVIAGGISPAYYHSTANVTAPVITVSASGNAGYTNLYHEDIWASDCSYINITQTPFVYSIYSFLKSRQTEIFSMQQGAVQPHVYPSDLMRIVMADAPKNIWKKCETIIASLYNKIGENILENKTLTETRDALLPKLLSGELSVNDVEA